MGAAMMLGLRERRARERRRRLWRAARAAAALAVAAGVCLYVYRLGRLAGGRESNGLRQEIAVLTATVADLRAQAAAPAPAGTPPGPAAGPAAPDPLADAGLLDRLLERNAELEAEIDRLGAEGVPDRDIAALVRQKLDGGVPPERLKVAIAATTREPVCEGAPVSRRFVVATPLRRDEANGAATFADSAITVPAEGAAPPDARGRERLRFDPRQAVTVRFAVRDGAATEVSGVLPLEHTLVLGGQEHRFTAEAGAQGLLRVTDRVCRFP